METQHEDREPLGAYAALSGLFTVSVGGAVVSARHQGKHAPPRIDPQDLLLVSLATFKLSRLISSDRVMRTARAPFTEPVADGEGHAPVAERPRGRGLRRAVGELLTCPHCLGQWLSAGFVSGLVLAPRPTRLVASVYTAMTVADVANVAWRTALERT